MMKTHFKWERTFGLLPEQAPSHRAIHSRLSRRRLLCRVFFLATGCSLNSTSVESVLQYAGGSERFLLNQTMGGGTWVYLGNILFQEGQGCFSWAVLKYLEARTDRLLPMPFALAAAWAMWPAKRRRCTGKGPLGRRPGRIGISRH
jgi:hypothetical protein